MRGYFGQLWRQTRVRYGERALSGQPTVPLEVEEGAWAAAPQGVGEMEAGADQERDVYKVGLFGELIAEESAERQEGEASLGSQHPFGPTRQRSEPREHEVTHLNSSDPDLNEWHLASQSRRVESETRDTSASADRGAQRKSYQAEAPRLTREEVTVVSHSNSPRAERQASPSQGGKEVVFAKDTGDGAPSFSARPTVLQKEIIEKSQTQADAADSISPTRAISRELGHFGPDSAPAWQTAMQQVREWVAAPPASNQASQKQEPSIMNQEVEPIFAQPPASRVVYRESSTQTPHLEAKSQEFHLSIGTISLTIEEPRPESQPISQPIAQTPSKPENRRSRLSRHYLRI